MMQVILYPEGLIALAVVLLTGLVLFLVVRFLGKALPNEYDGFYTTELKFQEPPACHLSLLEDRLKIDFGPYSDLKTVEIPYATIEACGREPTVLLVSTVFVVSQGTTYYVSPERTKQFVLELSKRIDESKSARLGARHAQTEEDFAKPN